MNNLNNTITISGTIGLKILENIDKKVFIFYDDHSNNSYCENPLNKTNKTHKFISELFDGFIDKSNQITLILEEPFIDNNETFKVLWQNSKHLLLFRKYYAQLMNKCSKESICKMFPIDIRIPLFDISPDQIIFDLAKPNIKYQIQLEKYFNKISYLFDLDLVNELNLNKINLEEINTSIIVFIKKILNTYTKSSFYKKLKLNIIDFYKKFIIKNKNMTIYQMILNASKQVTTNFSNYQVGYPFNSNSHENFIDQITKISSGIMELYMIIIMLYSSKKNIMVYAGFYHSNNIAYILENIYKFNPIYQSGFTDNVETDYVHGKDNNCIQVDARQFNFIL